MIGSLPSWLGEALPGYYKVSRCHINLYCFIFSGCLQLLLKAGGGGTFYGRNDLAGPMNIGENIYIASRRRKQIFMDNLISKGGLKWEQIGRKIRTFQIIIFK